MHGVTVYKEHPKIEGGKYIKGALAVSWGAEWSKKGLWSSWRPQRPPYSSEPSVFDWKNDLLISWKLGVYLH